ncbi:MAG: hypothetical protein FD143_898 [Ignavibacteria bacterium]|nr:MAG: hypothetical protein FD143_898 [Ignavibacteria bacterium]KAF0161142.1 MAG: hypothetical protein FD188_1053 [Ignavibacteria bacterium]
MKSGQMFWGFFLLTLGALFLLVKYDAIVSSFDFIWDIWPLIFVFWGAMVIFKQTVARPIINAAFGIFLALLIFGLFNNLFGCFNFEFDETDRFAETYSQEYDASIKTANLQIDAGAGMFTINDTTSNLVDAKAHGILGEYDFHCEQADSVANIDFHMHTKNFNLFRNKIRNQLNVRLNPKVAWDFDINLGASKSKFDLTQFDVRSFSLETGATSTKIKFGDRSQETNVDIKMGAASLTLEIPQTVGAEINSSMALVAKSFDGFNKKSNGYYSTDNFDSAKKKIKINVDGGVSSFNIYRY